MKLLLVACSLPAMLSPAFAAVPTAKIQAALAKPKILCGRFEQSKQLTGIKKPVVSSGRFCVLADKGVLWRTLQPFPSTLRLTRDEIVQKQGDQIAARLDAKQEPMVKAINNVLFSLLSGDLGRLDSLFEGDGSIQDKQWNVSLKPREAGLAKVITAVSLEGDVFVKHIMLNEASGDKTSITFSAMQTGDAAITPEEAAQF